MEERAEKIVHGALHVFMKYGIKSVNMDDISRSLGMSKKTLYQYVADKNELVSRAVAFQCELEDRTIAGICSQGLNAIEEMFGIMSFISGILQDIHPSILYDLEKYHPDTMKEMVKSRHQHVFHCIFNNLERGKKEGLYRSDLSSEIIAHLYVQRMHAMFDPGLFKDNTYRLADIYNQIFNYHIHGIISEKGMKYLKDRSITTTNKNNKAKP
jgi:AcrR family transcriptional regulator